MTKLDNYIYIDDDEEEDIYSYTLSADQSTSRLRRKH